MAITRKKTTVYLDPSLLLGIKVLAASTGRHEYEVFEDALRHYLGDPQASRRKLTDLLQSLGERADLTDEAALGLAYSELRAARQARRAS